MMYSSNAIFFYLVVPKDKSIDREKDIVIKSASICDLIFLEKMLKFEADILVGHDNWNIEADKIIDVEETCRSMEFIPDGKVCFDEILKKNLKSNKHREILDMYIRGCKQVEISEKYGFSRQRVQQIISKIQRKYKELFS